MKLETRSTLVLLGKVLALAVVCGLLLSTVHSTSRETIDNNQQAFEIKQLIEVVGDPEVQLIPDGENFQLRKDEAAYGWLTRVITNQGYNGEIRFWLATRTHGEVLGVRVIEHQETPGLGDKLELSISDWVLGFEGTSLRNRHWEVKKFGGDFDQFSGATITPRAVILAVKNELLAQQQVQEANLDKSLQSHSSDRGEQP